MDKKSAVKDFTDNFFGDGDLVPMMEKITRVKYLSQKEILFLEGESGRYIYYLLSGSIKLYKTNDEGKEAIVHFVYSGDMFAEIILQLECCYPVTASAIEDCTLLEIDAAALFREIEQDPKLGMRIIALLSRRIKNFVNMIENLTLKDVRGRFLNYLANLAENRGSNVVELPVPKGDIALLLGTTPETFSRLLKKLCDEGILRTDGKKIIIQEEIE
ncbi:Crp/Fnr family transcriptional regulator [Limisalsivibrio acetivorans]|uniref:Crp/Fnr family transcriptional regulator n=1 Tax=Limisalsivibrio acetivorans TaxID=1304888 RepID=UPI0003B79AAF|nr:Crp/Fnr family transcriptional regulator [Limisalsivibrio acetivorans]